MGSLLPLFMVSGHRKLTLACVCVCSDIHVHAPFPMSTVSYPAFVPSLFGKHHTVQEGGAVSWTYLDSTGRPTVVLTKEGCTDMHGGDVLVRDTHSTL